MTTVLPFANNTIPVYTYEQFNYTISNPNPSLYTLQTVSNSTGFGVNPSPLYFTKDGNDSYTFSISDLSNNLTAGTSETFQLTITDGSGTSFVSSNIVTIGPGRFLDGSGNTLSNNTYTFYKNEPITPIQLVAPSFTLKPPTSIPALPPGLSFVSNASNIYSINGIPLVTVPNSNYQIIGVQNGGSKVITTKFNMVVSNERVRLNLSGSPIIDSMQIGTPIQPRVITAIPPVGSSVVRYAFATLPDGITVKDLYGNTQPSPFAPIDPSYTMVISGTPTSNAAYAFRNAGVSSVVYNIQASRTVPLPIVENSQAITFGFGETVLFDLSTIPTLYSGIPVDSSANFFRAATYFTSNVPISNIFSPDLRSDLSLIFVPSLSRANLSGTPISAGTNSFTIRAINSNGITRDYSTTIAVSNDSVSFSSPVGIDLCYNFILSRPLDLSKNGYYPDNIRFTASAASGRAVTLSAPALSGTGLSLDSSGLLTGIPDTVTPLTDLVVTANAVGSPATATKTVKFAILNDVFTFADVSTNNLTYIQNIPISSFQIPVTTLSERNVINYSQIGFPSGLTINPAGVVSGTPTSSSPTAGNVTIAATTGYASGSRDYSYNLTPDSMLFIVNPSVYQYQAGQPVGNVNIDAVAYSGTTVSNYDLSLSPTYGLTIGSTTGIVSGTWTDSIPPNSILPSSCNFTVKAQAGGLLGELPATILADPVVSNVMLFTASGTEGAPSHSYLYSTTTSNISNFVRISPTDISSAGYGFSDIQVKYTNTPASNVLFILPSDPGEYYYRGTHLGNISNVYFEQVGVYYPKMSAVANKTGTSTWWMTGHTVQGSSNKATIIKSIDDGQTWDLQNAVVLESSGEQLFTRDNNGSNYSNVEAASYLTAGTALKYSSNVLMVGGISNGSGTSHTMLRSSTDGSSWNTVTGEFSKECAYLSLDASSIWVATGSDLYRTVDMVGCNFYMGTTTTIRYSTDNGSNWTTASGGFNVLGYEVVYGNNTWLATGVSYSNAMSGSGYVPELRYSTDGSNWMKIDLSTNNLFQPSTLGYRFAPIRMGSLNFDGNYWNVLVNVEPQVSGGGSIPTLYRHDAVSDLSSGWIAVDISASLTGLDATQDLRYTTFRSPCYLYSGEPPINIQLGFNATPPGGPTFTSPTSYSYVQYQYIPITPIQISATGMGQVYFFVSSEDLPPGLSFNPLTNQITGTPAVAGYDSTTVYAKDDNGVSSIALNFTTLVPRVVRQQDGAGAYTSLLRQYTEVLAAQNARDNRVLPNQERRLGEFMSPEAPDVITQTNCCIELLKKNN